MSRGPCRADRRDMSPGPCPADRGDMSPGPCRTDRCSGRPRRRGPDPRPRRCADDRGPARRPPIAMIPAVTDRRRSVRRRSSPRAPTATVSSACGGRRPGVARGPRRDQASLLYPCSACSSTPVTQFRSAGRGDSSGPTIVSSLSRGSADARLSALARVRDPDHNSRTRGRARGWRRRWTPRVRCVSGTPAVTTSSACTCPSPSASASASTSPPDASRRMSLGPGSCGRASPATRSASDPRHMSTPMPLRPRLAGAPAVTPHPLAGGPR